MKENGGERERKQSRTERINDERGGRLSVCAPVHVSARVSDQCSIYTSQGVGGRERERAKTQATVTDGDRDWAELERSRGGRAGGES